MGRVWSLNAALHTPLTVLHSIKLWLWTCNPHCTLVYKVVRGHYQMHRQALMCPMLGNLLVTSTVKP